MAIGERLREERKRLKMTQADFAKAGGIGVSSLKLYEGNEGEPGALFLSAVANSGVDVQYVITGIPSASTLAPDENVLLDGYRALDAPTRRRMLAFMLGGDPLPNQAGKQEQVFNDKVGQALKVEGGLNQTGISFFGKPQKKK